MIKQVESIKLKNPCFIACWPGMGEVSFRAGLFLKENMPFKEFAYLDSRDYFTPQGIVVKDGILDMPPLPEEKFFYCDHRGKEIILFLSNSQPSFDKGYVYAEEILKFVSKFHVKEVFTFASIPQPIDHTQEYKVWVSATDKGLLKEFRHHGAQLLSEGQITGLNGLFLGVAKEKKFKGACLLGEIPLYTIQIENPRASRNILKIFCKHVGIKLDFSPFDERQKFMDEQIEKVLEAIRGESGLTPPIDKPLDEKYLEKIQREITSLGNLPDSARKRIEQLFKDAKKDISHAMELKKEMDKWGVYHDYEDRFLDLFRKKRPQKDH